MYVQCTCTCTYTIHATFPRSDNYYMYVHTLYMSFLINVLSPKSCVQYLQLYTVYALFMSFLLSTVHQYLFKLLSHSPVQAEVRTLTDQLESVKQDLLSEKHKNQLYQTAAGTCTTPAYRLSGQGESLVTLEMKELNERQRADLATTR